MRDRYLEDNLLAHLDEARLDLACRGARLEVFEEHIRKVIDHTILAFLDVVASVAIGEVAEVSIEATGVALVVDADIELTTLTVHHTADTLKDVHSLLLAVGSHTIVRREDHRSLKLESLAFSAEIDQFSDILGNLQFLVNLVRQGGSGILDAMLDSDIVSEDKACDISRQTTLLLLGDTEETILATLLTLAADTVELSCTVLEVGVGGEHLFASLVVLVEALCIDRAVDSELLSHVDKVGAFAILIGERLVLDSLGKELGEGEEVVGLDAV